MSRSLQERTRPLRTKAILISYENLSQEEKEVLDKLANRLKSKVERLSKLEAIEVIGNCSLYLRERGWL